MTKNKYIIFISIIFIQTGFILTYGLNKPNLFIDEFWSLNLANGNIPLLGNAAEYYNKIIAQDFWLNMITPTNGNINLENVWNNQSKDVHPPLYYMFLHLMFCLTPPRSISRLC